MRTLLQDVQRQRQNLRLLPDAVRALRGAIRSGVIAPITPRKLWDIAKAPHQYGKTIATLAAVAATRYQDQACIIDEKGPLSYAELHQRCESIAGALTARYGAGNGRSIGILCRNHRGFLEAMVAAARTGVDVVFLNTEFPGPQLEQVLQRHTFATIIHDQEFTIALQDAGYNGSCIVAWKDVACDTPTLDDLAASEVKLKHATATPGRFIILTSGTTGTPKGAPRPTNVKAFIGPVATLLESVPFHTNLPIYIAPPLFHGFGLAFLMLAFAFGEPVVVHRRFDAVAVVNAIRQHKIEIAVMVPTMLQRLMDLPQDLLTMESLSSLKAMLSAGSPLNATLSEKWMNTFGEHLYNLYGSSETGFGTIATPQQLRKLPGTIGKAPLGTILKIVDAEGNEKKPFCTGHICIGSGMVFDGYIGGGNKKTIDGLMNTGDLGYRDSSGLLMINGREDDMIVSGGENVFPQEIEELLLSHPAIKDATAFGVKDEQFGQRLEAYIVCHLPVSEDDIKVFLKGKVARYKVPKEIHFVDQLPRTPTGKVIKHLLREA